MAYYGIRYMKADKKKYMYLLNFKILSVSDAKYDIFREWVVICIWILKNDSLVFYFICTISIALRISNYS